MTAIWMRGVAVSSYIKSPSSRNGQRPDALSYQHLIPYQSIGMI